MSNNDTEHRLEFECKNCGEPIVLVGYYAKMMSFFGMPKKSGLCSKCVGELQSGENNAKKRKCSDVHPDLERDHGGH